MAITGYYIDSDWNYREVLLGFETLHETNFGANLSTILMYKLEKHQVTDLVITVTTYNASNMLMERVNPTTREPRFS